jgi:hypothetical protein
MSLHEGTVSAEAGIHDPPAPPKFSDVAPGTIVRAFGLEYAHLRPREGGDLYVTRYGWPHVSGLLPEHWYSGQRFAEQGVRLAGSSGHAYRVRTHRDDGRALELVVKFSRVAQDVPVVVDSPHPDALSPALLAEARFNSPLEEFGLVEELRQRALGPDGVLLQTQQPLAIYVPPETFELWEMGRSSSTFFAHGQLLAADQERAVKAIELDIRRIYILVYRWIKGDDAQDWFEAGKLDEDEFLAMAPRVGRDLGARGFRVLDNKPRHYILRAAAGDGSTPLRRHGRLVYGLVDFELLQRTQVHQDQFRSERLRQYWTLQGAGPGPTPPAPSSALRTVTLLGVEYVFGAALDGGKLWVVGREPRLFDYFLPDRWRRTRRVKLSAVDEVYLTTTRDEVDVVYRRSRTGLRPREDPLTPSGQRIREAGYNSPFEELAIAERLQRMGIETTRPRAIYRTGHESLKARQLRDTRREAAWASLQTPEDPPAAILCADFDYYTIWDTYRGSAGHDPAGARHVTGLARATEAGLIAREEAAEALGDARDRLERMGLPADCALAGDFGLVLDAAGAPIRRNGHPGLLLTLDALSAYDYGVLARQDYLDLIRRLDERLRAVDYEKLDPSGRHLLLTLDPDGCLAKDASGAPHAVLCNFALIRGLYRPLQ